MGAKRRGIEMERRMKMEEKREERGGVSTNVKRNEVGRRTCCT
jgi:hypothetical protein